MGDEDPPEPLKASDRPLGTADLPTWVPSPVEIWLRDLTFWEIHAMELGLLGLFAGPAIHLGLIYPTAFFTALFVGIAFGFRRIVPEEFPGDVPLLRAIVQGAEASEESGSIAAETVHREPWYFLVVYALTSVLSYGTFPLWDVLPSLL